MGRIRRNIVGCSNLLGCGHCENQHDPMDRRLHHHRLICRRGDGDTIIQAPSMTTLTRYLRDYGIDECAAMNALQNHGIVSDECVTADDVAPTDQSRAIAWLKKHKNEL